MRTKTQEETMTAQNSFMNPANGYVVNIPKLAALWALLFGPFYFAFHGQWRHVLIMVVLAIAPFIVFNPGRTIIGLSMDLVAIALFLICFVTNIIFYPVSAKRILREKYLKSGWVVHHTPSAAPVA
jgi:hypothetical protein